jgi:hypothetical protein
MVLYTAVTLTEPKAPPRKPAAHSGKKSATAPGRLALEDERAHFARYAGKRRDAFYPVVRPSRSSAFGAGEPLPVNSAGIASAGMNGTWALTGINTVNGVRSALIENNTTHEIQFLHAGDRWNGLRVVSIEADGVEFMNALQQQTRLTFAEPRPDAAPGGRAQNATANPGAPLPDAAPSSSPTGSVSPQPLLEAIRERSGYQP